MYTVFQVLALTLSLLLSLGALPLLLLRGRATGPWAATAHRWTERLLLPRARTWLDWRTIGLVAGVGYAAVAAFDLVTGSYGCVSPGATSDTVALLHSGQAFWSGGNPFLVDSCGTLTPVPYGLAAVLVDAVGSLGGLAGIAAAWGLLTIAILPLTWYASPPSDRVHVTLFVALLPIYLPVAAGQIDGASNSIAVLAVLSVVVLGERFGRLGEVVGAFLSTARFPSLFAVVASRGAERRWFLAAVTALSVFAATTVASYLRWGSGFYHIVFESQVNRRSFSLNLYGPLLDHGALPTGTGVVVVQAVLVVAISALAFFLVRSPLRAAALALVGYALITPFLSFSILLVLVPVALVGHRPRVWLWGVGLVGALNYELALGRFAWQDGNYLPAEALDILLTVLLLGLLVELWRGRREDLPASGPAPSGTRPSSARP